MISRGAREAMNEIDEVAVEELEDQRRYRPRRDYYETALNEVSKYGASEDVERLKKTIINSIKSDGDPIGKVNAYRRARRLLKDKGNVPPDWQTLQADCEGKCSDLYRTLYDHFNDHGRLNDVDPMYIPIN